MSVVEKFRRVRELPPDEVLRRLRARVIERLRTARARRRDRRVPSYGDPGPREGVELTRLLRAPSPELFAFRAEAIREAAAQTLAHRFDQLGSGLTSADHGTPAPGFAGHVHPCGAAAEPDPDGRWLVARINRANLDEARRTWRLVSPRYRPIDWQRDLRSGHRWSESLPSVDQGLDRFPPPGADVKLPWELGRMQHLPVLAWAYALSCAGASGFDDAERYRIEFCDEIADFRATNPPRFGVQWACTMDVAIRIVSWLAAYDLFRGFGATFSNEWSAMLARSVREHAAHIAGNLERAGPVRANHYLADVAGLAFAAAALPRDREVDGWLWFAAHEFVREVGLQFHADGSNFEASTAYHRLSSEMAAWTTAVLIGLPDDRRGLLSEPAPDALRASMPAPTAEAPPWANSRPPLPLGDAHWQRIHGMGDFIRDLAGPDGRTPSIGDDDSGRFLKLVPRWRAAAPAEASTPRWSEDGADHRHAAELAESVCGTPPPPGSEAAWEAAALPKPRDAQRPARSARSGGERNAPSAYPEIGIFTLRRRDDFLTFRCGPVGQAGNGGHSHNDQLSLTLHLDGCAVLVDPGTYVYTAIPDARNRFRSTAMHNTLQVENLEQNAWFETRAGLFELHDRARARIERVEEGRLAGSHDGFGVRHRRDVRLADDGVHVVDVLDAPRRFRLHFHFAPAVEVAPSANAGVLRLRTAFSRAPLVLRVDSGSSRIEKGWVSPGYGILQEAPVAIVEAQGSAISWSLVREEPG